MDARDDLKATHALSVEFFNALHEKDGILNPLLQEVKADDTLLIGLRGGYITIYYRGGQLLKIEQKGRGYSAGFDRNYDTGQVLAGRLARHGCEDLLDKRLESLEDTARLVDVLSELKRLMDRHPKIQGGLEREFQQVCARVNNRSKSSNSSHYFITDIEHKSDNARFDMLGVRWRRNIEHHNRDCLVPVIFEMKYGLDALDGKSGLAAHLEEMLNQLGRPDFREKLSANIEAQFNQLSKLELLRHSGGASAVKTVRDHVQIVFVLAEYVPHSHMLKRILKSCDDVVRYAQQSCGEPEGPRIELLFATAALCGYAMHENTMLTIDQVEELFLDAKGSRHAAASAKSASA